VPRITRRRDAKVRLRAGRPQKVSVGELRIRTGRARCAVFRSWETRNEGTILPEAERRKGGKAERRKGGKAERRKERVSAALDKRKVRLRRVASSAPNHHRLRAITANLLV
jgi:hypothetical protein